MRFYKTERARLLWLHKWKVRGDHNPIQSQGCHYPPWKYICQHAHIHVTMTQPCMHRFVKGESRLNSPLNVTTDKSVQ